MRHQQKAPPKPLNALDPVNGLRVGLAVGAFAGAALALVAASSFWMVLIGSWLGGLLGYASAKTRSAAEQTHR